MKLFKGFVSISIFLSILLKCVCMMSNVDELPNDVGKLKEMYLEQLADNIRLDKDNKRLDEDNKRLDEDNKYLNEVVLGEVPIRHRRTMLKKMKKLDQMTEECKIYRNSTTGVL